MTLLDWAAVAYWPISAAIALLFSLMWQRVRGDKRRILAFSITVFVVSVALIVVFFGLIANQSKMALIDSNIFFVILGGFFFLMIKFAAKTAKANRKISIAATSAFAIIFTGIGFWYLIGDFAVRRNTVEGFITDAYVATSRSGRSYHVLINGRHHPTTADVFSKINKGERVRAEVGAASGNIFAFQPI